METRANDDRDNGILRPYNDHGNAPTTIRRQVVTAVTAKTTAMNTQWQWGSDDDGNEMTVE